MEVRILNTNIAEIIIATKEELDRAQHLMTQYNSGFRGKKFHKGEAVCVLWARRFFPVGMLKVLTTSDSKLQVKLHSENWIQHNISLSDFIEFCKSANLPFTPYEYQYKFAWYPIRFGRSFCEGATSSGKTFMSYLTLSYLIEKKLSERCVVIVPSVILVEQFANDYEGYHEESELDTNIKVFKIHADAKNIHNIRDCQIVVSTYHSLANVENLDFFKLFNAVFIDEAHGVQAMTMISLVEKLKHVDYRFGMTGTLPENKLQVQNMYSYIGYHFDSYKAKELIDAGRAAELHIQPVVFRHNRDFVLSLHGKLLQPHRNKKGQETGELNIEVKQSVLSLEQLHCLSNDTRNKVLSKFVTKFDKNLLILTKRVQSVHEIANNIRKYCEENGIERKIHVIAGNTNRSTEDRDRIIASVEADPYGSIIVANMDIFSTGVSINALFYAFLVNVGKSDISVIQALGRLMRLHELKKIGYIFDIADEYKLYPIDSAHETLIGYNVRGSYLRKHQKERIGYYKKEQHTIKDTAYIDV